MRLQSVTALPEISDDTLERFQIYQALVRKWTPKINLVSRRSLNDLWERHFRDSLQLFSIEPTRKGHWVDLGSGGGFPGMVLAIAAAELRPELRFSLVESDKRKAVFLRTVSRETSVPVAVISERIESVAAFGANIVSARALAPLPRLIEIAKPHMAVDGVGIFPKGIGHEAEIRDASEQWSFDAEGFTSRTDPNGVIYRISNIVGL